MDTVYLLGKADRTNSGLGSSTADLNGTYKDSKGGWFGGDGGPIDVIQVHKLDWSKSTI